MQSWGDDHSKIVEFNQKSCTSAYKFQGEGLKNQHFRAWGARFLIKINQNLNHVQLHTNFKGEGLKNQHFRGVWTRDFGSKSEGWSTEFG